MTDPERPEPGTDERPEPGLLQTAKWSLVMVLLSLVVAAVAIPILRWFD